ncbi:FAD-binding oxidoreductase [Pararhizobium sp. YC-54]|uniref:NAD(P)/FAD-dependent oxidoreductase n=1 Tax=Pararhizobium sp. YC-54 TaxID=2986920 RepID=UPI0021F7C8CD|nr:FAD-binding oxidoreductase [Pararhizobium sp. YC-54]MCW0001676.1 FAD-binding oxidoreductase [Pararhizobium sp. YC-54]
MADLLIVGGGIMGLWAAVMADRAGLETVLVERDRIGAGASGGVLGALMPHMPDRWNAKKQFQFEALISLETEIAALEAETGLSAGYRRSGRIMPLAKPHLRTIALRHEQDALVNWRSGGRQFHWHVQDRFHDGGWLNADAAESGVVFDTLAARVAPRPFLAMLASHLRRSRHVRIEEGQAVVHIDPVAGRATFIDGSTLSFGACILANGVQAFPFIDELTKVPGVSGVPVKGQAALLQADIDPDLPVVFTDGLYVVAHENGLVAVGSTSENTFENAASTDGQLDDLLRQAAELVPLIRRAPVIERWAGLRPKAIGRDPMAGRHPDHPRIHALAGGFKISFGIAHRLASAVVGEIVGGTDQGLPSSFRCQTHIELLRKEAAK